jgi:ATP-dependent helicase HrpA
MSPTELFWIPPFASNDKLNLVPARPSHAFPFRLEFPPELPISARAEEITAAIQAHQVIILAGETGSGKTTQIPKMCLAAGRGTTGRIACTQPRRVAALSVSRRVADEMGVTWGREVGSKIRFNDETTGATVVKFLTDGMLLAEVQGDPLLREYDTVIIDEAHERSLNIDFLLGHLRTLRYKRPELKIVITSATIDTAAFSQAFDDAPIIQVEGRTFPVEVIYAPLDELGSDAAEGDGQESRAEALHYIDGTVEAVERIVRESTGGDILAFLPSERDIREVREMLEGRRLRDTEVVSLFGRLSNAEQQRVFAPTQRRKIVLATNIAETSLTIPGIRFVVDTGLARISRYSPQARTRRLPIEAVSQSSADQRKGRSGRVTDGVCIRLYSEKDFLERPRFTQPEIQRANLADVILRMKAFGLGDIERFPFINMPSAKSIRAGYALLDELGTFEDSERDSARPSGPPAEPGAAPSPFQRRLTAVGRELARLPVDPTVGRMILQARAEKALREVVVIAAGLSIQDPRERPMDKQQQADAAHRRFAHPDSDFLTLLNIWDTYHDEVENLSQARLRRFCRDHFLSYTRLREWRDIHAQLLEVLKARDDFKLTSAYHGLKTVDERTTSFGTPPFRAIHRSILAGLLGNIAHYDEENGNYKATHDRRVNLFPGSVLFRRESSKKSRTEPAPRSSAKKESKYPRWLMAAEIMETSRLYARTCARLDPLWALDLGAHVVRVAHSEPSWNAEAGRVMVNQRTRLYGLELESRGVGYGKINPLHATEILIREGLVNDTITYPLDFLSHNRVVRENVEAVLSRTRDAGYLNLDEAAYRFYAAILLPDGGASSPPGQSQESEPFRGISSVPELIELVRERRAHEPRFLMMEPENLRSTDTPDHDVIAFPAELPLENRALPLNYAYKPGQTDDGVTLDVNIREAEKLSAADLDWAVPGHLEPKVEHYLRVLPKELRRAFVPLAETARSLAGQVAQRDRLTGRRETLVEALAFQIAERFRVAVDPQMWMEKPPPEHLRVRVRVKDDRDRELCASRELDEIQAALHAHQRKATAAVARIEPESWRRARVTWEKPPQATWGFGNVPDRVLVTENAGVPVFAFPGLQVEAGGVAQRLFKTPEDAQCASETGLEKLLELSLGRELGWLERDLRSLRNLGPLTATLVPMAELQEQALFSLRAWLCAPSRVDSPIPKEVTSSAGSRATAIRFAEEAFTAAAKKSKADLQGLVEHFTSLLQEILSLRQSLLVQPQPYPGLQQDLAALVPADFLRVTPYTQLAHFPRYLRAMQARANRWKLNPAKDAERTAQLAPYLRALDKVRQAPSGTAGKSPALESRRQDVRWLIEEFRVSLFAQELGTAQPVSAVKLERAFAELGAAMAGNSPPSPGTPAATPRQAADPVPFRPLPATPDKKAAPLKNLSGLDRLFQR